MSGLLPPSLAGFTTSPSTCGVFGLLNSGGAFMTQIMGSVGFAQASLQGAAAMLMSLPGQVVGIECELSTTGGTSDARFIRSCCPVLEFGLVGETMHKVDEKSAIDDLRTLSRVYQTVLDRYFAT